MNSFSFLKLSQIMRNMNVQKYIILYRMSHTNVFWKECIVKTMNINFFLSTNQLARTKKIYHDYFNYFLPLTWLPSPGLYSRKGILYRVAIISGYLDFVEPTFINLLLPFSGLVNQWWFGSFCFRVP